MFGRLLVALFLIGAGSACVREGEPNRSGEPGEHEFPFDLVAETASGTQEAGLGSFCWEQRESTSQCDDAGVIPWPSPLTIGCGDEVTIRFPRAFEELSVRAHRRVGDHGELLEDGPRVALDRRSGEAETDVSFRLERAPGHFYVSVFGHFESPFRRGFPNDAVYGLHFVQAGCSKA